MAREGAKRTKLSPTLPREVILQLAQYLPDEDSFDAYIEALKGTTSDQGPFEALRSLERSIPPWDLWPNLELCSMADDEWELALQAIPVYNNVTMHALDELHRLVGRVSPSTNLVVIYRDTPGPRLMRWRFRQLAQLPVRGLIFDSKDLAYLMPMVIPRLCNVFTSLTNLRCLELLVGDQPSLESICNCVAKSQITELHLDGENDFEDDEDLGSDEALDIAIEAAAWTHLVAWLHSTRVIRFDLSKVRLMCDDQATMQALNGALAASDALRSITWVECDIHISAPLVLPPRLQKLSFPRSPFALVGVESTLKQLPTMPHLTHVRLDDTPMSPSVVDTLASVLAQSNVSFLSLYACSIGNGGQYNDCIQRLADAFEASASLRYLGLAHNDLQLDGVKAFLEAVERRPFVTGEVNLMRNNVDRSALDELFNTLVPSNTTISM